MFTRKTFRIFLVILGLYGLAGVPYFFLSPQQFHNSIFEIISVGPFVIGTLFVTVMEIPGLAVPVDERVHCMFTCPTPLGVAVVLIGWLLIFWILAWLVSLLTGHFANKTKHK